MTGKKDSLQVCGLMAFGLVHCIFVLTQMCFYSQQPHISVSEAIRSKITSTSSLMLISSPPNSLDDPLIWGILPLRLAFEPWNLRWGLGSHDICFKNQALGTFFTLGQVLPVHRSKHSPHAGLFQPSMTQAIRLLSSYPYKMTGEHNPFAPIQPRETTVANLLEALKDPFSDGSLTYSTTGRDVYTAPSAFLSNRHAWVHVFPEGLIHQHPERQMRYFKWGVARLILEAEPMPDMVPMFIDGTSEVMHEDRGFPRFVPRAGKKITVAFGDKVDMEATFGDLRARWKHLVSEAVAKREGEIAVAEAQIARVTALTDKEIAADRQAGRHGLVTSKQELVRGMKKPDVLRVGELPEELKYSKEVEAIRIEVARRVRDEVLKVRKSLGYPDEDPRFGLAETWKDDPKTTKNSPVDGSIEKPST